MQEFPLLQQVISVIGSRLGAYFHRLSVNISASENQLDFVVREEDSEEVFLYITVLFDTIQVFKWPSLGTSFSFAEEEYSSIFEGFSIFIKYLYSAYLYSKSMLFEDFLSYVIDRKVRTWADFLLKVADDNHVSAELSGSKVIFQDVTFSIQNDLLVVDRGDFEVELPYNNSYELFALICNTLDFLNSNFDMGLVPILTSSVEDAQESQEDSEEPLEDPSIPPVSGGSSTFDSEVDDQETFEVDEDEPAEASVVNEGELEF